jgi:phosphatidylserine/phosphatidylglycerophosphate/cardiolipin synthase-like enzyme
MVTSANPSAYGSKYSNVALFIEEISNGIHNDIYESEKAIAAYSDEDFVEHEFLRTDGGQVASASNQVSVQFLTEGKIRKGLIEEIDRTQSGESIEIAMFLLTERELVNSLLGASERGVEIRIVLDPSKYLFGRDSQGVPNRPVMAELHNESKGQIKIRWYQTHGEEFHSKMVIVTKEDGEEIVFLGSANLTRRNIGDYNLEADIKLAAGQNTEVIQEINDYFEKIWNNQGGTYTVDYDEWDDDSWVRYSKYWLQEQTGLCAW